MHSGHHAIAEIDHLVNTYRKPIEHLVGLADPRGNTVGTAMGLDRGLQLYIGMKCGKKPSDVAPIECLIRPPDKLDVLPRHVPLSIAQTCLVAAAVLRLVSHAGSFEGFGDV
jgi:hypothetical protein